MREADNSAPRAPRRPRAAVKPERQEHLSCALSGRRGRSPEGDAGALRVWTTSPKLDRTLGLSGNESLDPCLGRASSAKKVLNVTLRKCRVSWKGDLLRLRLTQITHFDALYLPGRARTVGGFSAPMAAQHMAITMICRLLVEKSSHARGDLDSFSTNFTVNSDHDHKLHR